MRLSHAILALGSVATVLGALEDIDVHDRRTVEFSDDQASNPGIVPVQLDSRNLEQRGKKSKPPKDQKKPDKEEKKPENEDQKNTDKEDQKANEKEQKAADKEKLKEEKAAAKEQKKLDKEEKKQEKAAEKEQKKLDNEQQGGELPSDGTEKLPKTTKSEDILDDGTTTPEINPETGLPYKKKKKTPKIDPETGLPVEKKKKTSEIDPDTDLPVKTAKTGSDPLDEDPTTPLDPDADLTAEKPKKKKKTKKPATGSLDDPVVDPEAAPVDPMAKREETDAVAQSEVISRVKRAIMPEPEDTWAGTGWQSVKDDE
ncbi:hypothetical protein GLAREA_12651 [Glarea lozoyensis ATCC 20868]|uniref:Uncharacterized protein n=1 Tax=Glarea lozoyensis (strain ATCC 20868 / MF5171) TaxID=1116229 RepID=S3DYD3_GLAL2|nr:uncharacterized protein GLAREA_12651 [Glarea lozoyensis ATCC 20868]EPE31348.1 hypothetical protein GLAREA_12651 [Glarea lozoyensis ATCC 20868]